MVSRTCKALRADGKPCRAAPLSGSDYCLMHDPANADAVAEARKVGGARRRKEATVRVLYDFEGTSSISKIQRVVDVALVDTLALDNSVARNRTLIAGAQAAAKLLEVGELAERIKTLEAAVLQQKPDADSPFTSEPLGPFIGEEGGGN